MIEARYLTAENRQIIAKAFTDGLTITEVCQIVCAEFDCDTREAHRVVADYFRSMETDDEKYLEVKIAEERLLAIFESSQRTKPATALAALKELHKLSGLHGELEPKKGSDAANDADEEAADEVDLSSLSEAELQQQMGTSHPVVMTSAEADKVIAANGGGT